MLIEPRALSEPIARGRTADVFAWHDGYVLKLFHAGFDQESIEREAQISRAVYAAGLPVPAVVEKVCVDGRTGLVYQRLAGPLMWDLVERSPWRILEFARRLGELHAQVHSVQVDAELPSQRERLESKIRYGSALTPEFQEKALTALAAMPQGAQLAHGDLHPANILMTAGADFVIDWIDATRGNPLADVARTSIILVGDTSGALVPNPIIKFLARIFHRTYLQTYLRHNPLDRTEYQRWIPIVAAARLSENIPEIKKWLLSRVARLAD